MGGGRVTINDIQAYAAFAAVDLFMGATAMAEDDPRNKVFPGKFSYGGAHVIEDLVAGKDVRLTVTTYGTDCYPRRGLDTWIRLEASTTTGVSRIIQSGSGLMRRATTTAPRSLRFPITCGRRTRRGGPLQRSGRT